MRFHYALALVLTVSLTGEGFGQARPADVDELRRQIDALQRQLNSLETGHATPSQKVTQLGTSARQLRGEPELTVRVYDLSDLFAVTPAYTPEIGDDVGLPARPVFPAGNSLHAVGSGAMGGGGFGGGGFFDTRSPMLIAQNAGARNGSAGMSADVASAAKTSIESLIDAIQTTISPDGWDAVGGNSTIARIGTSLIVRTEPSSHEQIDALFNLLRQRWGTLRTVSVRAWWVLLNEQQLAALLPGNGKGKTGVDGVEAFGVVDEAAWNRLFEPQADGKTVGASRAVITGYNGQTVHTTTGSEEGIVNDIEPILTHNENGNAVGRIAYKPTVTAIQEGTALQITPIVNASGRFVMIDVHSRVSIREPEPAAKNNPAPAGEETPAAVVAALDRPRLMTQRLSTTLRAPVDRVMLAGGMTLSAKPQGNEPTLYLFLKPTVQELRDDTRTPAAVGTEPAKEPGTGAGGKR
jgi:hypothetical protein